MAKKNQEKLVVKCPKCGYEYLIPEIFFPEDLFGKITDIVRDENHIIFTQYDEEPKLDETWVCDTCGCEFKVHLDINSKVTYEEEEDFSTEWESIKINTEENK